MITLRNNTPQQHVAELRADAEKDLLLGRGVCGLPDVPKIHRQHARIGWRGGACVAKNLGKNKVGVQREGGRRDTLFQGRDWVQLNDGDQLCFLTYEADAVGLRFNVTVTLPVASSTDEGAATPEVAVRAKPRANDQGSLLTHAQWGRVGPLTSALEQGQDPNSKQFRQQGAGPLHLACQPGAPGALSTEAARRRKAECVTVLLEFGADPDVVDDAGFTPLQYAVSGVDQPAVVKALLQGGASTKATVPGPDGDIDVKTMAQMQNLSESVAVIEQWEAQCAEDARAIAAALDQARMKFEEFDKDNSGALERGELDNLSLWVFESFHPGGETMTAEQQDKEVQKLLQKMDDNGDGVLSLDEFVSWFRETSEFMSQSNRSKALKEEQALASSRALAELDAASKLRKAEEAAEREALAAEAAEQQTTLETLEAERKSEGKLLKVARKQFNALDKDGNGTLEGMELVVLAQWVFTKFNPGGGPGSLDPKEAQVELEQLMETVDTDGNGSVSFDEFSEWFVTTTRSIHRKHRRLHATEDSFSATSEDFGEETQVAATTEAVEQRQEPREKPPAEEEDLPDPIAEEDEQDSPQVSEQPESDPELFSSSESDHFSDSESDHFSNSESEPEPEPGPEALNQQLGRKSQPAATPAPEPEPEPEEGEPPTSADLVAKPARGLNRTQVREMAKIQLELDNHKCAVSDDWIGLLFDKYDENGNGVIDDAQFELLVAQLKTAEKKTAAGGGFACCARPRS